MFSGELVYDFAWINVLTKTAVGFEFPKPRYQEQLTYEICRWQNFDFSRSFQSFHGFEGWFMVLYYALGKEVKWEKKWKKILIWTIPTVQPEIFLKRSLNLKFITKIQKVHEKSAPTANNFFIFESFLRNQK